MPSKSFHTAVIGGGAAGFFAAIQCARRHPHRQITIYEKGSAVLAKVRVSGGGRCNVTHAAPTPKELVQHYPRGGKELLGPFHTFQPKDTIDWFKAEGVELKTEADGRLFPVSDQSLTIVNALTQAAKNAGVIVRTQTVITSLEKEPHHKFKIQFSTGESTQTDCLLLATGSAPAGYRWATHFGHTIVPPVPSLFTLAVSDPRLKGLSGISVGKSSVRLSGTSLIQTGPLLITHWGLSGPAILTLSSWGARLFSERNYQTTIEVNWIAQSFDKTLSDLKQVKERLGRKPIIKDSPCQLPKRLWERLITHSQPPLPRRWADCSNAHLNGIASSLTQCVFQVTGKSTFKEEFVTCGGVQLNEINFKTMESRLTPGLFFAGEILDIDAVTGGFNFQNAWTTGWVAGTAMGGGTNR